MKISKAYLKTHRCRKGGISQVSVRAVNIYPDLKFYLKSNFIQSCKFGRNTSPKKISKERRQNSNQRQVYLPMKKKTNLARGIVTNLGDRVVAKYLAKTQCILWV